MTWKGKSFFFFFVGEREKRVSTVVTLFRELFRHFFFLILQHRKRNLPYKGGGLPPLFSLPPFLVSSYFLSHRNHFVRDITPPRMRVRIGGSTNSNSGGGGGRASLDRSSNANANAAATSVIAASGSSSALNLLFHEQRASFEKRALVDRYATRLKLKKRRARACVRAWQKRAKKNEKNDLAGNASLFERSPHLARFFLV